MINENAHHSLEGKTVIVAGGGIAGSAFAASLERTWDPSLRRPTIHIFERDAQRVSRHREGNSLSLAGYDATGGLVALEKMGLLDQAMGSAISGANGSGSFIIWDADWNEKIAMKRPPAEGMPASSIRIARKELRRILHKSLQKPQDTIHWGVTCESAETMSDGRIRIAIRRHTTTDNDDGQDTDIRDTVDCDLLIVADGASSKLRASLRPDDPGLSFAGVVLRGGLSRFPGGPPPQIQHNWGFQMSGDGVSCFYSPVDEHSIIWMVSRLEDKAIRWRRRDNEDDEDDAKGIVARARELGSRFAQPFDTVVDHTDLTTAVCLDGNEKRAFCHDSPPIDKVPAIFIGDSNHALTPMAGYGANLALHDACDLAERLCQSATLAQAVKEYDAIAVPRAAKVLEGAQKRLIAGHRTGWRLWFFYFTLFVGVMISRVSKLLTKR